MNICPFCREKNTQNGSSCAKCKKEMYSQPQTEWTSQIAQVAQGYRSGKALGLAHGLQKDAVQNSWGARKREKDWTCEFELLEKKDGGSFLIITDAGTYGLAGKVFEDQAKIPDSLPSEERLARFENMNFSGGNSGPGLYGRGKLIFQAASKSRSVIYDSLIDSGEYRLGRRFQEGRKLLQFQKVLINDDAKEMLKELSGGSLSPLKKVGARIIILDPLDEIIEAVSSGAFLDYIGETWWEIIHNNDAQISVTYKGSKRRAVCPKIIKELIEGKFLKDKAHLRENGSVTVRDTKYRVKRILMGESSQLVPERLRGLHTQRKGMLVGSVDLRDMPSELADNLVGFIQLDLDYEKLIEEAEDLEHYSFSATYASYRELKKYAQSQFEELKKKLGYDVAGEKNHDQRTQEALRAAEEKLNQVMKDLGFSGTGRRKSPRDITLGIAGAAFPGASNRVEIGDKISGIKFIARNKSAISHKLNFQVESRDVHGESIEKIGKKLIEIPANSEKIIGPYEMVLKPKSYTNGQAIFCVCTAIDSKGEKLAQAKLPIFIGMDAPDVFEPIAIHLSTVEFPKEQSTRVNYGESIKNVRYAVKNQTPHPLKLRATTRTERDEDTIAEHIYEEDFILGSFEEKEIVIPEISVSESKYRSFEEGAMYVRTKVVSLEEQHGYKKGRKMAKHIIKFWLNQDDPSSGIFEDKETFHGGPDAPRAMVRTGSMPDRWVFMLNITHPQYEAIADDSGVANAYVFELMARETLYIALYTESFDAFQGTVAQEDEPHLVSKAYNSTLDKVLASYYK